MNRIYIIKEEKPDTKKEYGKCLQLIISTLGDGLSNNPVSQLGELPNNNLKSAVGKLMKSYSNYLKDRRLPNQKKPDLYNKVTEIGEQAFSLLEEAVKIPAGQRNHPSQVFIYLGKGNILLPYKN